MRRTPHVYRFLLAYQCYAFGAFIAILSTRSAFYGRRLFCVVAQRAIGVRAKRHTPQVDVSSVTTKNPEDKPSGQQHHA